MLGSPATRRECRPDATLLFSKKLPPGGTCRSDRPSDTTVLGKRLLLVKANIYCVRALIDNYTSGRVLVLVLREQARVKKWSWRKFAKFLADAGVRCRRIFSCRHACLMPLGPTHLGFICPKLWFISKNNRRGSCQFCAQ